MQGTPKLEMNNMTDMLQQTLDLTQNSQKTFDNFICPTNIEAKKMLAFYVSNPSDSMIVLKGDTGTGKTHLLQAACHQYQLSGRIASYVPLRNPADIEALLSRSLAGELVCIDGVHTASLHDDLEHTLFRLYNHAEMAGCKLIWSMHKNCEFTRKDLVSRKQAMLSIELLPYNPDEILQILEHRVSRDQLFIPKEVCAFLIKNYTRNINQLISKAKEIEQYAYSVQKKVTLKMAKSLIFSDLHQLDE
ncbi:MAG: DnaA/Hda family protein [Pseudomonadota bacterium]|nr:DnaA/Hda family protein [Pseudomonadota bacterium]